MPITNALLASLLAPMLVPTMAGTTASAPALVGPPVRAAPIDEPTTPGPRPPEPTPADDGGDLELQPGPLPEEPLPEAGLSEDYVPPFDSEEVSLAQVLEAAVQHNLDLALGEIDVEISEAQVLAALGAYDVFLTAGINGNITESPQRGSQFAFSLGSRTIGGNIGFFRALETGGQISLDVAATRTLTDQPVNFFDAEQGATTLSAYTIRPVLTLTHPLLQGAGLKVNMADINRAKIATSQAEAAQLLVAQNLARDIIAAYWDVLFAHRNLINQRRSVELAQKQLERTEALVAAGRLSPVDAKAVQQGLAARESDVINAENTLLDASITLRTLVGQQFVDRDVLGVLPTTDPIVKPRPVDIQAEVARALQTNPQIRQLELAQASLRIDEMVAANRRLPQLDFTGTFTPQGRSIDSVPDATTGNPGEQGSWAEAFRNIFSEDPAADGLLADWTLSGSLTLTWDIQNRGPKGAHEAAKLQIKRSEVQLDQSRQQVAAGVIRAANSLRTASKVMEVSNISLELAAENLAAEQARFQVGRSTNFDVLLRLDELDEAAAAALQAQISYLQALVQLQALTGEILPAYGLIP